MDPVKVITPSDHLVLPVDSSFQPAAAPAPFFPSAPYAATPYTAPAPAAPNAFASSSSSSHVPPPFPSSPAVPPANASSSQQQMATASSAFPTTGTTSNVLGMTGVPAAQQQVPSTQQPAMVSSSSTGIAAAPSSSSAVPPSGALMNNLLRNESFRKGPIEFNQAINYVNKIKNRYANDPDTYKQFLEILQTYQKEQKAISEVYSHVHVLFKNAPDLLEEFKQFLPEEKAERKPALVSAAQNAGRSSGFQPVPGETFPQKRTATIGSSNIPGVQPVKKKQRTAVTSVTKTQDNKVGTSEELEFFDKVKRTIGTKSTYNEFLKILNLFSQEIIDIKTLVEKVTPFLERTPEILDWFKKFVKYEEEEFVLNIPAERPSYDIKSCKASGHSYRLMPKSIPRMPCSGRDALGREVFNDDWISHPVYLSETGFVAHKKNVHEEALYKCEEERYEFDRHIEANQLTIALLEPINRRINTMSADEKAKFRLPVGLGGDSKTIYQWVIKKIYDKDRGAEVIEALHQNPAVAVPVVLKRLKQKDEEWKRSKREWNKVWKEIEAKNFYKALDHKGIHFKTADRKTVSPKSLLSEIDTILREQKEKNSSFANRYQLDFIFKDPGVFEDAYHLIYAVMDVSGSVEERIREDLLKGFLMPFFGVDFDATIPDAEGEGLGIQMDQGKREAKFVEAEERKTFTFYANSNLYVLLRLYQILYARLYRMKELSNELAEMPARTNKVNAVAVELGLVKMDSSMYRFNPKDRYGELVKFIFGFLDGKVEASDFEEKVRAMYHGNGYLMYTVDKLCQSLIKQLQIVATDSRSMEMLNLYHVDRVKPTTSSRQEAMYRLSSESHVDDCLYRFEFFTTEKVMTIQLLAKDDHFGDESITSEEKWSLYVDHFVQLSTTESGRLKRQEPFLKRNLPVSIPEEPPTDVETRSGLELKICLNTYKIFFVNNTEDFFYRKGSAIRNERFESERKTRHERFRKWLESDHGWKKYDVSREVSEDKEQKLIEWMSGDVEVETVQGPGLSYRRFISTVPPPSNEGEEEVDQAAEGEMDVDQP